MNQQRKIDMTTDKVSNQHSEIELPKQNPLADIAGKFGGEFWLKTQTEIKRSRKTDREEINRLVDSKSDKHD